MLKALKSRLKWMDAFCVRKDSNVTKRWLGIASSALSLILSLPLCLFVALAIKLDSSGPVFYRQERVGQDGKTFTMLKFRSMRNKVSPCITRHLSLFSPIRPKSYRQPLKTLLLCSCYSVFPGNVWFFGRVGYWSLLHRRCLRPGGFDVKGFSSAERGL